MPAIYSFIAQQNFSIFVCVAGVFCMAATYPALTAGIHAARDVSRRRMLLGVSAVASALASWAAQLIAMLAHEPGVRVAYDIPTTLLSLLVGIVIAGIGWIIMLDKRAIMAPLGGAIIGGGAAAQHFIGLSAARLSEDIVWNHGLLAAALALGVGLSAVSTWIGRRMPREVPWLAGSLFAFAICSLHFIATAAATIHPNEGGGVAAYSLDGLSLAILAVALIVNIDGGMVLYDRQLSMNKLGQAQQRAALADEILRGAAERERLTAELRHQAEISAAALDNMVQGLTMHDEQDRLVIHNRRFIELYEFSEGGVAAGTHVSEIRNHLIASGLLPPDAPFDSAPPPRGDGKVRKDEVRLLNGRIIKVQRRPLPGGGWVATHEDVTEAWEAHKQIAFLATHDTLTGLPNRVRFGEELSACVRDKARFALCTIDLDRFKEVNDTLGHPVGNEILKGAAARLLAVVGDGHVVTRLGGDEFAVIQKNIGDVAEAAALAGRIIEALGEPFEFEGHTVVIGASVGISVAPDHGTDGDELLKMSDLALYGAKDESRGTYRFFECGMDSRLSERRQLEADLRVAIREGQFEVHYQPLLDTARGRIRSFEALVRWRHPSRGLIAPADFIATAEDTGLIIPIGEWVLRQACRDAAGWPVDVGVAVNLSPSQFKRGDLIAMTTSALAAANLAPERLELEITESVLLHDEAWVRTTLERLTALGVRIAMDDFGTGYSSLSYLRSFPFTKIKIDRSFIVDLVGTTDALSIVQATIQLSQKLGMEVTAEGVETAEQLRILAEEGCTQVQGYHVSRPVPVISVAGLLEFYNSEPDTGSRAAG